jgi:hypothetical protein
MYGDRSIGEWEEERLPFLLIIDGTVTIRSYPRLRLFLIIDGTITIDRLTD